MLTEEMKLKREHFIIIDFKDKKYFISIKDIISFMKKNVLLKYKLDYITFSHKFREKKEKNKSFKKNVKTSPIFYVTCIPKILFKVDNVA